MNGRYFRDGHGIAYKAWLDVAEDVRAGRLVTLVDEWHGESVPFNLLYPHRGAGVRALSR